MPVGSGKTDNRFATYRTISEVTGGLILKSLVFMLGASPTSYPKNAIV